MPGYLEQEQPKRTDQRTDQRNDQRTEQIPEQLVCILCNSVTSVLKAEHNCLVRNNSDVSVKRSSTI